LFKKYYDIHHYLCRINYRYSLHHSQWYRRNHFDFVNIFIIPLGKTILHLFEICEIRPNNAWIKYYVLSVVSVLWCYCNNISRSLCLYCILTLSRRTSHKFSLQRYYYIVSSLSIRATAYSAILKYFILNIYCIRNGANNLCFPRKIVIILQQFFIYYY